VTKIIVTTHLQGCKSLCVLTRKGVGNSEVINPRVLLLRISWKWTASGVSLHVTNSGTDFKRLSETHRLRPTDRPAD
jgi:hypothetical protein